MVSVEEIRQQTRKVLGGADLDKTSRRSVRQEVGEALKLSKDEIRDIKKIIEEEIEGYIKEQDLEPLPASPSSVATASAKKSRDSPASEGRPAKQRKTSSEGVTEFELAENRRVTVREFKGKQLIDVREFYEKDGELKPGAKGVAMSQEQWQRLAEAMPELSKAVEGEELKASVDLGSNKFASVTSFKGRINVDLREHYEKDGNMAPGKKGIALPADQWQRLCGNANQISAIVGTRASKGTPPYSPAKSEPRSRQKLDSDKTNEIHVDLGNNRRASISDFKGRKLLDLREFYEKDGEMKPGKKGISLSKEQAESLKENMEALSAALSEQRELSVVLGPKRYARVNSFKNVFRVDIREYYEKEGEEKPGAKGLSLTDKQWTILAPACQRLIDEL